MKSRRRTWLGVGLATTLAACIPSLGPGDSLVTSPRILAVRAEPAEVKPGGKTTFTVLVAAPAGSVSAPDVAWSYCSAPKPITEDNVVSSACLETSSLVALGAGATRTATMPMDACALFGPDGAAKGLRPRDPDATGGYYQPLRLDLPGASTAFELARVRCNLANADADAATAFAAAYVANQNPTLQPLGVLRGGQSVPSTALARGEHLTLRASWPSSSAETFALFDASSQTVTKQRESMQVAWYVTGGALDTESTGRASTDPATTSDDGWTAPSSAGTVFLWTILRDSRGGVAFAQDELVVH